MLCLRRNAVLLVSAIAFAGFFVAASSSHGATTIGSDLVATPNAAVACGASPDCTYVQTALVGAQLTATNAGVIVRWRLKTSAGGGGSFKLRVVRNSGVNIFLGVSSSSPETPTGAGINSFNTRLPIAAGDQLGIDQTADGASIQYARTGTAGATNYFRNPAIADGASLPASNLNFTNEFLLNADIEADADTDGFGDESQDACPSIAGQTLGCPPVTELGLTAAKRQKLRKLQLVVTSNIPGAVAVRAVATTRLKRLRRYRSALLTAPLTATSPTVLKPKFSKKVSKLLSRQLATRKKVTVKITVSMTDVLGKVHVKTASVKLKR